MSKYSFIVGGVIVLLVATIFYFVFASTSVGSSSSVQPGSQSGDVKLIGGVQEVSLNAGSYGYDKTEIRVKKGIPVKFSFSADSGAGCGRMLLIRDFGVRLTSNGDVQVAQFTPTVSGRFPYSCPMNMFRGVLIVE